MKFWSLQKSVSQIGSLLFDFVKVNERNVYLSILLQVISGHTGWVRSVAVEPGNQWFATGSADRTIKVQHQAQYKYDF